MSKSINLNDIVSSEQVYNLASAITNNILKRLMINNY